MLGPFIQFVGNHFQLFDFLGLGAETFNDHVHHVFLQLLPLFQSQDFAEGMASFMEKREAEFKGR